MTVIIGIDPGVSTGIARYVSGRLALLQTIQPWEIERYLIGAGPMRVIFEDSRLESRLWHARTKGAVGVALATARSVGQVDAWCSLICAACEHLGVPAHGISPKAKGAKVDAGAFARITGWTARTNQHERDAAMVAWPYRTGRKRAC